MKRKLYFFAGIMAMLLFAACSNLGQVSTSASSITETRYGSDQPLTIKLENSSFDIARNIFPGDWTDGDQDYADADLARGLVYILTGFSANNTSADDIDGINAGTTAAPTDSEDFAHVQNPDDPSKYYIVLTYDELMSGKAIVNLKPLIWYLTLTAYQRMDATFGDTEATTTDADLDSSWFVYDSDTHAITSTSVALVGHWLVDMTEGAQVATFKMRPPEADTTAYGKAIISLSFNPPDDFTYMEYAFYGADENGAPNYGTPATDAVVPSGGTAVSTYKAFRVIPSETAGEPPELTQCASASATAAAVTGGMTVTATSGGEAGFTYTYSFIDGAGTEDETGMIENYLVAGTYWFRAVFWDDQGQRMCVYVDKVIIDGTNTSQGVISLLSDVFNGKPSNIENLTMSYTFNSVTFTEKPQELYAAHQTLSHSDVFPTTGTSAKKNTYTANLSWKDVADNEVGYQILVTRNAGTSDEESFILDPDDSNTEDDEKLAYFGLTANKLNAGVSSCALTLYTGIKYKISVRAYNDWSKDYAADTAFTSYQSTAQTIGHDFFVPYEARPEDATDKVTFGLYTIDYNLNGGIIYQTHSRKTRAANIHYVVPYIYMEEKSLIGQGDTPYINRTNYNFVGWSELYGNSAVTATSLAASTAPTSVKGGTKLYFTSPNYGSTNWLASTIYEIPTDAIVSTDTFVKINNSTVAKVAGAKKSTTNVVEGDSILPGTLATYSFTKTVYKDSGKYYAEAEHTNELTIPAAAILKETSTENVYTWSSILQAGGTVEPENYQNRELFASWETPLAMSISLPAYPDFKITKGAAAGEPYNYQLGLSTKPTLDIVASDKLSEVTFTIYKDSPSGEYTLNDLLSDADAAAEGIVYKGGFDAAGTAIAASGTDTAEGKQKISVARNSSTGVVTLTWTLADSTTTGEAPNQVTTWSPTYFDAMTYYVKVHGVYTYDSTDTSNSLAGTTEEVEGFIYVKLTN